MRFLAYQPLIAQLAFLRPFLDRADLELLEFDADSTDTVVDFATLARPQIVLLDEDMPGGGLELARRLRSVPAVRPAAILIRTLRLRHFDLDGVIAVPRGDGDHALAAALTQLLLAAARASCDGQAIIQAPGRGPAGLNEAQLVDVSTSGCKLRTAGLLRVGEVVAVALVVSPGEPLVLASARVIRAIGEERGGRLFGLEFVDLGPTDRDRLQRWIDRALHHVVALERSAV
jgi:CheY-like chemotaxis protein